jgi:uncharacterized OsmC-like protein
MSDVSDHLVDLATRYGLLDLTYCIDSTDAKAMPADRDVTSMLARSPNRRRRDLERVSVETGGRSPIPLVNGDFNEGGKTLTPQASVPRGAMAKEVVSTSEEGSSSVSSVRDFELEVDAAGEETPDTVETLLADYAACYVPALRVGGRQRGVDDLGKIENTVTGEVNDDGKLTSISFDIKVEADVDDEKGEEIVERADELCKVHDALKESLHHSGTSLEGGAF